ncbi:MAG: hypothetical protein HC900_10520, partial [Methylacidiphilales bacterium]|nr:hypothetical protein [Candidatus Methylacidiphilales bacterium]
MDWLPDIVAWSGLLGRAAERNIFYAPGFALAAAGHLLQARADNTLGIHHAGVLTGLFPGSLAGGPLPVWRALVHPYGPLSTPLVDRSTLESTLDSWLGAVTALRPRPHAIILPRLSEDGPVAMEISRLLSRRGLAAVRLDVHERAALFPTADAPAGAAPL